MFQIVKHILSSDVRVKYKNDDFICSGKKVAKQSQTTTLSPPCLTAGMILILWNAVLVLRKYFFTALHMSTEYLKEGWQVVTPSDKWTGFLCYANLNFLSLYMQWYFWGILKMLIQVYMKKRQT